MKLVLYAYVHLLSFHSGSNMHWIFGVYFNVGDRLKVKKKLYNIPISPNQNRKKKIEIDKNKQT